MNSFQNNILLIDNQGLSHFTCYLAKGLAKYYKVTLLGFSEEDYQHTDANLEENITFTNFGRSLSSGSSLFSKLVTRPLNILFHLFKPIIYGNYRVIIVQGHLPFFYLYIPFLKLRKRKIFWVLHDVELRPSSKGLRGKLEILYTKFLTQSLFLSYGTDVIVVHGKDLKAKLEKKRGINTNKIIVLPHFDYKYLNKYIGKSSLNIPLKPYILFFGNIKPYKGLDIFLKAITVLEEQLSKKNNFNVLIAGRGNIQPYLNILKDNNCGYIEIWNQNIPSKDIPDIFLNSKMVVLPYLDASQSGIIPLAYTFSKSVIVSDVGSLTDYVDNEKTGFIFEKGNVDSLIKCIIKYYENDNLSEAAGKNAYDKLTNEMSLEYYCSELRKLIDIQT